MSLDILWAVVVGPIFVTADEPLMVFESLDRAMSYLEWQDVENGLYRGYDSAGRLIAFGTEPRPGRRSSLIHDKRVVADVEHDPTHADQLRQTLVRILAMPEATALDHLQAAAIRRFGIT